MTRVLQIRLAEQAERDFFDILSWTAEKFGAAQARTYGETLTQAIEALHEGPAVAGAQARDELGLGIRTLHVARQGRKGRHFVVFRPAPGQVIEVLRLLHDSMDLARLVPPANDRTH